MSREFRVLSKLHAAYSPAPQVLLFCDDLSVLGSPFYVMKAIHGIILRQHLPSGLDFSPEKARGLSKSFFDNLIQLHRVDYAAVGLADLGKAEGYLERQVRGWIERYTGSKTHDYPEAEKICSWLAQHLPSTRSVSLVHNDYKYDNLVLHPADITNIIGVLDWEMCTIGDSLTDLGTALAYWIDTTDPSEIQENCWGPTNRPGSFTRAELVHYYAQKSGEGLSGIAFYLVLARFKLAVIVQQIYFRYQQGLTQDERFAAMPSRILMLLQSAIHTAQTGQI
jgi:aminoglycoside phosphotransferase (APT) family kinase protein